MLKSYQDKILAGLVKKGYTIGPAASDLTLSTSGESTGSYMLAFTAHKSGKEVFAKDIYEDILSLTTEMKAFHYGIIVAHSYDAMWVGANFNVQEKKPPALPNTPPPNKSNLN